MADINSYKGCFIGLAIGDALGARYEGGLIERLLWKFIGTTKNGMQRYTDDTQMSIDLAESFLANKSINQDHLAKTFANSYQWTRGYGPSTASLLKKINKGQYWNDVNKGKFKTGSFGNGAAMRAPILALCFPDDIQALINNVIKSSEISHAHCLGIEGAKLIALATHGALRKMNNEDIFTLLIDHCDEEPFEKKLILCRDLIHKHDNNLITIKRALGNQITAIESCITSIYFSLEFRNKEFGTMHKEIIKLGGDTDTIGAMSGAIWGAFNGYFSLKENAGIIENNERILYLSEKIFELTHDI